MGIFLRFSFHNCEVDPRSMDFLFQLRNYKLQCLSTCCVRARVNGFTDSILSTFEYIPYLCVPLYQAAAIIRLIGKSTGIKSVINSSRQ